MGSGPDKASHERERRIIGGGEQRRAGRRGELFEALQGVRGTRIDFDDPGRRVREALRIDLVDQRDDVEAEREARDARTYQFGGVTARATQVKLDGGFLLVGPPASRGLVRIDHGHAFIASV